MCVIIDRGPNVVIPAKMIELACDINKHGYGFAFADRGHLEIMKSSKQPNDPEEVLKKLEELKRHRVFLHLRHATVGAVNDANQHPFVSLTAGKKDRPLVGLMHNGTIHTYSPPIQDRETSDTLLFNERLVKPLLARSRKAVGEKKLILDSFVRWLLEKETGSMSKIVLFDAFGNSLFINKQLGKQYEGWWASNDYSFDVTHHRSSSRPSTTISRNGVPYGCGYDYLRDQNENEAWWLQGDDLHGLPWAKEASTRKSNVLDWEKEFVKRNGGVASQPSSSKKDNLACVAGSSSVPKIPAQSGVMNETRTKWEIEKAAGLVKAALKVNHKDSIYVMSNEKAVILRQEKVAHEPFVTQAGIASLDVMGALSKDDLLEMATSWPQATSELVVDLLYERLQLKTAYKHFQQKFEKAEEDKRNAEARITRQADFCQQVLNAYKAKTGETYPLGE